MLWNAGQVAETWICQALKNFGIYVYIAISSRPFVEFPYPLTDRLRGYSYQQGISSSVCPSVDALFVRTLV